MPKAKKVVKPNKKTTGIDSATSAKGKGLKGVKPDKERVRKDDDERKIREEEEQKLLAIEEKRRRKQEEKQKAHEQAKLKVELIHRRNEEHEELSMKLAEITSKINRAEDERKKKAEWDRYITCDGTPDPLIAGQINAYINLWKEDTTSSVLGEVLKESKLTLALIEELFTKTRELKRDWDGYRLGESYKKTIYELQQLLLWKLDEATQELLERAINVANKDTGNLEYVAKNENIIFCIWGNLAKNARIKFRQFDDYQMSFSISRTMATREIGIRFIMTNYDHYSWRSINRAPLGRRRPLPELPERCPTPPAPEYLDDEEEGQENKGQGTDQYGLSLAQFGGDVYLLMYAQEAAKKAAEAEAAEMEKEQALKAQQEEEEPVVEEIPTEIPVPDEVDFNPLANEPDVVNLHMYSPIYGVMHIDLIAVPPQPTTVNGWTMKQLVEPHLKYLQLSEFAEPAEVTEGDALESGMEVNTSSVEGGTVGSSSHTASVVAVGGEPNSSSELHLGHEGVPPPATLIASPPPRVTLSFRIPETVSIPEPNVIVGLWNEELSCWKTNSIFVCKYSGDEKREITFETEDFGPFCCFQDSYVNMPFQQWEMHPLDLNHALINIETASIGDIVIEVKGSECRLVLDEAKLAAEPLKKRFDRKPMKLIANKWVSPLELISMMKRIGVNIFPESYAVNYVSITEKDAATEDYVYEQMAMTASAISFAYSRYNADVGVDTATIIIQAKEGGAKITNGPSNEDEWKLLSISDEKMYFLNMTETSEDFSDEMEQGARIHFDLVHLFNDIVNEEKKDLIHKTDPLFIDAVYQLLSATKCITYS